MKLETQQMIDNTTIPKTEIRKQTVINSETHEPEDWFFCQDCGYGIRNEKAIQRHIKKHEKRILLTCAICGQMALATIENFWRIHLNMRYHAETHKGEQYDLFGEKIVFGYGWTDNAIAVKQINNIEQLEEHKQMIRNAIEEKNKASVSK